MLAELLGVCQESSVDWEKRGAWRALFAWLNRPLAFTVRYGRLADGHLAFLDLGCALKCGLDQHLAAVWPFSPDCREPFAPQ